MKITTSVPHLSPPLWWTVISVIFWHIRLDDDENDVNGEGHDVADDFLDCSVFSLEKVLSSPFVEPVTFRSVIGA